MALYNKHLDSFVRVVDYGSFAKASEELFISANALIKHVNLLERDLGMTLLERSNKGVRLTPAGQYIYDVARKIIADCYWAESNVKTLEEQPVKRIRVGISIMRPLSKVMQFWQAAQPLHPDIDVELVTYSDDLRQWPQLFAKFGESIDVVASPLPSASQEWFANCRFRPLYRSAALCMVPLDHPLANRQRIRLADLAGETLFMCAKGYSPEGDAVWELLEERCPRTTLISYEPFDFAALNEIAHEDGLVYCANEHMNVHPGFAYIPFEDDLGVTMGLLYGKDCPEAVSEFVEAIAEAAEGTDN